MVAENPNWQGELKRLMNDLEAKENLAADAVSEIREFLASIEDLEAREAVWLLFQRRDSATRASADFYWFAAMAAIDLDPETAVKLWTKKEEISGIFRDSVRGIIDGLQDNS